MALGGVLDCQPSKHVTLKDVVVDDIFIGNKFEVLANYIALRLKEESRVEHQKQNL